MCRFAHDILKHTYISATTLTLRELRNVYDSWFSPLSVVAVYNIAGTRYGLSCASGGRFFLSHYYYYYYSTLFYYIYEFIIKKYHGFFSFILADKKHEYDFRYYLFHSIYNIFSIASTLKIHFIVINIIDKSTPPPK